MPKPDHLLLTAGFTTTPPTIDEFLDQSYYLGHIGKTIYPFWREKLREVHGTGLYSPYNLVLLSGSTGGGKSMFCLVSMLYELCVFLHREDPYDDFGFNQGEPLAIALCNNTLNLSLDVQIKRLFNMFNNSPFFKEQQAKAALTKVPSKGRLALNLPNNIDLLAGSLSNQLVGRAIITAMISELNIQSRQGGDQAVNTFQELKNRLYTRFYRGDVLRPPGKLYLDSSRKEVMGVMDQYIDSMRGDPSVCIIEAAFWDFVAGSPKDKFSGKRFFCFKGTASRDPFVVEDRDEYPEIEDHQLLSVPIEMYDSFKSDPVNQLRDFGGISTHTKGNFITSIEAVQDSMKLGLMTTKPIVLLDMYNQGDSLINYLDFNIGILKKDMPYYVHMDLSKNKDRTGIAFCRAAGNTEISRFDRNECTNLLLQDKTYSVDLLICLKNKPNQEIPIYKIQDFFVELSQKGYLISKITADQFGSLDLIQRLVNLGYQSEKLSVDKPRNAYDVFRQTLYERRIKLPNHHILRKEIVELVDFGDYVDHPEQTALNKAEDVKPSKDLIDAVVGALWGCVNSSPGEKGFIALNLFTDQTARVPIKPITTKSLLLDTMKDQRKKGRMGW